MIPLFPQSPLLTCLWLEDMSSAHLSLEAKCQKLLGLAHNGNSDHWLSHLQCARHYTILYSLHLHTSAFKHATLSEFCPPTKSGSLLSCSLCICVAC